MTKKQIKEHKFGNQVRRIYILRNARTAEPQARGWWARTIGAIQKGRGWKI